MMPSYLSRRTFVKTTGGLLLGSAASTGHRASAARELERIEVTQFHMSMLVKLTAYVDQPAYGYRVVRKAFREIRRYVGVFSCFDKRSELSRLCAQAGRGPIRVSKELYHVLSAAKAIARQSGGAFDPTAGALTQLWRTARRRRIPPTAEEIERAALGCGYQHMALHADEKTVALMKQGVSLDLGGVAKGYIGDLVIRFLRERGIPCAAYEAGGDIVVGDAPPESEGWVIDVHGSAPPIVIHNEAVSISGDTHQHLDYQGRRYSHVIDPLTGTALVAHQPRICRAPTGLMADVEATLQSIA